MGWTVFYKSGSCYRIVIFFLGILAGEQKGGIFAPTNPKRPVRLGVRTADFHSVNRGSIPLRATKKTLNES
ncbi:MAG: hypothetical protein RLZZ91_1195 [Bacteroidota bacterium]